MKSAGNPLPQEFYVKPTVQVAQDILGCVLVHNGEEGVTAGVIVEAEAYCQGDPACHAARGRTTRNAVMFGPPGHAYVYFTYGNHWCLNAVTQRQGVGEAALIRALEPLEGLDLMRKRRGRSETTQLCSGPGKLTQAMGITRPHNGMSLSGPTLLLIRGPKRNGTITATPRIGITVATEKIWRFCLEDSPFLSRPVSSAKLAAGKRGRRRYTQ